jgi:hypothetical protein
MDEQWCEFIDDMHHRTRHMEDLLQEGRPLGEAVEIAFCLDSNTANAFVGRMYAEMMGYGQGSV